MVKNEGGMQHNCMPLKHRFLHMIFLSVFEKHDTAEPTERNQYKYFFLFIQYTLLHTVLLWRTPVSLGKAFASRVREVSLKFNYMFVLTYVGKCEPLRRFPSAWKNTSGDAVQNFNAVPLDRSCSVFSKAAFQISGKYWILAQVSQD